MRESALRMLVEAMPEHPNLLSAAQHAAAMLTISPETLRVWQRQAEVDGGRRSSVTSEAAEEIKRLKRENVELRKTNEIRKAATVLFTKELDRP